MSASQTTSRTDESGRTVLVLDSEVYPLEVIYGACYVFIDRVYLLLGREDEHIRVELTPKEGTTDEELHAIAGDFGNELLTQALRLRLTRENRAILETIVGRALAGATGGSVAAPAPIAEEDLDFLDDPLGIAVPWEERFDVPAVEPAEGGE